MPATDLDESGGRCDARADGATRDAPVDRTGGRVAMNDMEHWAKDRAEIESLMVLFARGHDVNSRYYERCMADDVEIDYGDYEGGKFRGLAALQSIRDEHWSYDPARPERGGFTFTWHVIANALIEVDGDTGRGEYYVHASHGLIGKDGEPAVVPAGALYTQDCVRTPDGWRLLWIHDPMGRWPPPR
jgi:SnoaL-like domain